MRGATYSPECHGDRPAVSREGHNTPLLCRPKSDARGGRSRLPAMRRSGLLPRARLSADRPSVALHVAASCRAGDAVEAGGKAGGGGGEERVRGAPTKSSTAAATPPPLPRRRPLRDSGESSCCARPPLALRPPAGRPATVAAAAPTRAAPSLPPPEGPSDDDLSSSRCSLPPVTGCSLSALSRNAAGGASAADVTEEGEAGETPSVGALALAARRTKEGQGSRRRGATERGSASPVAGSSLAASAPGLRRPASDSLGGPPVRLPFWRESARRRRAGSGAGRPSPPRLPRDGASAWTESPRRRPPDGGNAGDDEEEGGEAGTVARRKLC
jgi:hypothetical protein